VFVVTVLHRIACPQATAGQCALHVQRSGVDGKDSGQLDAPPKAHKLQRTYVVLLELCNCGLRREDVDELCHVLFEVRRRAQAARPLRACTACAWCPGVPAICACRVRHLLCMRLCVSTSCMCVRVHVCVHVCVPHVAPKVQTGLIWRCSGGPVQSGSAVPGLEMQASYCEGQP